MAEDDDASLGVTIVANPPFTFGIGLQGELLIGWVQAILPDGRPLRAHLVIPAEELPRLQRGLEQSKTIRETLAAKPPKQGAH